MKHNVCKTALYMSALAVSATALAGPSRKIHGHDMHSLTIEPAGLKDDKVVAAAFQVEVDAALDAGWHFTTSDAIAAVVTVISSKGHEEVGGTTELLKEAGDTLAQAEAKIERLEGEAKAASKADLEQKRQIDDLQQTLANRDSEKDGSEAEATRALEIIGDLKKAVDERDTEIESLKAQLRDAERVIFEAGEETKAAQAAAKKAKPKSDKAAKTKAAEKKA